MCGEPCAPDEVVVDHCHTTGEIRGVLHRGCNAMLGHLENNMPRNKLTGVVRLSKWLAGVIPYLHGTLPRPGLLYPTHKTEDEKRLLRNKRARTKRAKDKLNAAS